MAYKSKQMVVMRHDLKMRKGKIAAQAGHACVEATLMALAKEKRLKQVRVDAGGRIRLARPAFGAGASSSALTDWFDSGIAKVCVYVNSEEELLEIAHQGDEHGYLYALIRDAGLTEFSGEPTITCLAFEPLPADEIDQITGSLPLY